MAAIQHIKDTTIVLRKSKTMNMSHNVHKFNDVIQFEMEEEFPNHIITLGDSPRT